jgi:hypothetical protein
MFFINNKIDIMDEFNCICGNVGVDNFTFAFAMADGEVWNCKECKEDIITEFDEDEESC